SVHAGLAALRGTLKLESGVSPGISDALTHSFSRVGQGTLAVRAWVNLPTVPGDYAAMLWITRGPNAAPFNGYAVTLTAASGWIVQAFPQKSGTDHHPANRTAFTAGAWSCLELRLTLG